MIEAVSQYASSISVVLLISKVVVVVVVNFFMIAIIDDLAVSSGSSILVIDDVDIRRLFLSLLVLCQTAQFNIVFIDGVLYKKALSWLVNRKSIFNLLIGHYLLC